MFNKKGYNIGMNTVLELILAVTVLIILIGIVYVVFVDKEDVFTRKICQISVYLSDQTVGIFQKLGIGGIFCKTYHNEFEDLKKNEFLEKIAENMRQCWWMWGEGKLDPAGDNLVKWSDYQCFNCYVIEPLGAVPEITAKDLENYLITEYIPDSDISYWNYFKGFNNNGIIFNFPSLSYSEEPLFKKGSGELEGLYAITFVEDTEPSTITRFLEGGAVGATFGAVACSFSGPGALVCGTFGGIAGSTSFAIGTIIANYFEEEADAIMISEFDETKNVCSGEIE